ncbi:MAG TPA: VWA domain-containing protein [Acidobacteriaceae bacterium]|nr:VWA domain-containing protein [Acidobacteriaceae bacterium]
MRALAFAVLALTGTIHAPADAQDKTMQTIPTLRVTSRSVLVDIVVTDHNGQHVHGLPQSAFHITDNGQLQSINSFEEHVGPARLEKPAVKLPQGVYTNALLHAPSVETVLFIDTTNMEVTDQMVLYRQLIRFVDSLPSGVPLRVFVRAFDMTAMVQDLTDDPSLLKDAIRKAVPHPQIASAAPDNDAAGLAQVAGYLSQVPGRKNLLWFSGGSSMFTHPGPWSSLSGPVTEHTTDGSVPVSSEIRLLYDLLETARIAVYSIDVRGLSAQRLAALPRQRFYAVRFAAETGGEAFFNRNDMIRAAEGALQHGDDSYSLSYSPAGLKENGAWHSIRVSVEGDYRVSYRRGYYDDGPNTPGIDHVQREHLLRVGKQQIEAPNARMRPLIFRAQVASAKNAATARRGKQTFTVHFDIPAVQVQKTTSGTENSATIGAAIVAFNQAGQQVSQVSQDVHLNFDVRIYKANPLASLSFDLRIDLPRKRESFLHIAAWDAATGRMGSIEAAVQPSTR